MTSTPLATAVFAVAVLWAAACGSASGPAPGPPAAPVVVATPALAPDDLAVATVNGRTVWGSCVATQAQVIAASAAPRPADEPLRRAALDQCISFELLAQAAETRGAAAVPEVVSATRAAAVNRLIATDFEQRYRSPADLKGPIDGVMQRNEWRMHIVQLRASTFARFAVPKEAGPDVDAKAHALADKLAAEVAGQTGLYGVHLTDAGARIAEGSGIKFEKADVRPSHPDDLVKPYSRALYAIPEIGQASPAVRTDWGWDVIVWTGGVEAKESTRDEVVAEIFPELRRRQFHVWVTQISKQLGLHVDIDQAAIGALDTVGTP